jgi:hypothetical protein
MHEERRSMKDRRTGKDRRRKFGLKKLCFRGKERRSHKYRREPDERRHGWVRLGKWSGIRIADLKIGKFLKS